MPQPSIFQTIQSFIKRKTSQQYKFNEQFSDGTWDGLKGIDELGRYSIIVGYIDFYCKKPHILDLGCGEGILLQRLGKLDYGAYLGIDFSDVAITNCRNLENDKARFEVGDLDKLKEEGRFDTIIYNESIYYLSDHKTAINALLSQLNDDGVFIFSIVDKHGKVQDHLWESINSLLTLQDMTRVTNRLGHSWTIGVYKKKA